MTRWDAFKILGLSDNADKSQIRHAYSEKVKIYHVETHPEEFARLHEAYKTAMNTNSHSARNYNPVHWDESFSTEEEGVLSDTRTQPPISRYEDILSRLVEETPFSITHCQELTQLIYHKYKYLESPAPAENFPDNDTLFLHTPWRDWKDLEWLLLICHPDFIRKQYSPDFLAELFDLLQEENTGNPGGIGQEFYFTLCTAYGFFLSEHEEEPKGAMLQAIRDLLSVHPRHRDYVQNLRQWEEFQINRCIACFCQEAVRYSQDKGTLEDRQAFAESFLDRAEILLMDEATPNNEFILRNLISLPDTLFSQDLSRRKQDYQHMQKALFDEFTAAFDPTGEGHSLEKDNYIPIARRLTILKNKYLPQDYWGRVIRSSGFILRLRNWLRPTGCRLSLNYYFAYDVWREVRCLFDSKAPYQNRHLVWLQTEAHFSEYEKRYQQELLWRRQHVEDAYFRETFPLPRMNMKKHQLLFTVSLGTPAHIGEMHRLLGGLHRHDKGSMRFFERLTSAMVHFNFLLVTPTYEENPVPDDIICFLKDEVILYRKKERLTCHLSHAVFYDYLARAFDSAAECYNYKEYSKQSLYSEDFINTCCKNMYYYDCFVHSLGPAAPT